MTIEEIYKLPYKFNVISLGSFCSPAIEIKNLNLRLSSYPFDWLITTNSEALFSHISNNFKDFFEGEYQQSSTELTHYYNPKAKYWFFHEFSSRISFYDQIDKVKKKYQRRIKRFYKDIKKPTIFIRYVISQDDADYIHKNASKIEQLLKSYNCNNQIVYLFNDDLKFASDRALYFVVKKDENDTVARLFMSQCDEFRECLINKGKHPAPIKKVVWKFKRITAKMEKKISRLFNSAKHLDYDYIHNNIIEE